MAEFQEVMKNWSRMCNSVPGKSELKNLCSDKESGYVCPLKYNSLCYKPIVSLTDEDIISGENIIAAWVAEHPEPVYPTWGEWFLTTCQVPLTSDLRHNDWETLLGSHIPADLAQKLGVKPKEG